MACSRQGPVRISPDGDGRDASGPGVTGLSSSRVPRDAAAGDEDCVTGPIDCPVDRFLWGRRQIYKRPGVAGEREQTGRTSSSGGGPLRPLKMAPQLLCLLLSWAVTVSANVFEYQADSQPLRPCELLREKAFRESRDYVPQCLENGQFRTMQCGGKRQSCWCVDAEGAEVPGSKRAGGPDVCLSFCQLQKQQILLSSYLNSTTTHYLPRCRDSGDFEPVQCDVGQGQCWCVDAEGMEVYGTRQPGRPAQCPGSCEIRGRRVLHGVGERSPPQCSADGQFSPVQCKFVNTTDTMVFDLVHSYGRSPDAFLSFSVFRRRFPEVSAYCHCVDSLGRELAETGLELLLDEIYDTIFASLDPTYSFSETPLYRILQRRFLGVQLALTGQFRCPSQCEVERLAATTYGHAYVPSCDAGGAYRRVQCQREGPCWCVDANGREIYATRSQGQRPTCGSERLCVSERRRALSRLLFGSSGQRVLTFGLEERGQPQEDARSAGSCPLTFEELLMGSELLPDPDSEQRPVPEPERRSDPRQRPAWQTILSELVRGLFPTRELALTALRLARGPQRLQQDLFGGMFLTQLGRQNLSGAVGPRSTVDLSRFFRPQGAQGPASLLPDGDNVERLDTLLAHPDFPPFLRLVAAVPTPLARDLGEAVHTVLEAQGCGPRPESPFIPACSTDGGLEKAQCSAGWCSCTDDLEAPRFPGRRPRCPTECEKQRAAGQRGLAAQPAGSRPFIPACADDGSFLPVQCSDDSCFCVDADGLAIPGTHRAVGDVVSCPSSCQLSAGQALLQTARSLLSDSGPQPPLSSLYIPQCQEDGRWSQVQCSGPPAPALEWYQRWVALSPRGPTPAPAMLIQELRDYRDTASTGFEPFVRRLFEEGRQGVFPGLAGYASFRDVPSEFLEGRGEATGASVWLEPFPFWQLLTGQLRRYPGPYSDFSSPPGSLEGRSCWCVSEDGEELAGTRAERNEVPVCPGACEEARRQVLEFLEEAEDSILASNFSHSPLGERFLLAHGILLTSDDLFPLRPGPPETRLAYALRIGSESSLALAVQSTLQFYQRASLTSGGSAGEAASLRFRLYVPQCDGLGNWEPLQCHGTTGHCWCVDRRGHYITDSLATRDAPLPQCPTPCEASRTNALVSGWKESGSEVKATPESLFTPTCLQTGEYARLQRSESGAWCLDPATGEAGLAGGGSSNSSLHCPSPCSRAAGEPGITDSPTCEESSGEPLAAQCDRDQETCWCLAENGQELPGTRVAGRQPSCHRPLCPLPFDAPEVAGGAVLCEAMTNPSQKIQQCRLECFRGYRRAVAGVDFTCNPVTRRWLSAPPLPQACQKLRPAQTVQLQAQLQLLLPPEKMCSADYSGLLRAFQIFMEDALRARDFCRVQVDGLRSPVSFPVCDESTVRVECLTAERLGVNLTWVAPLASIPAASLPYLHDIENALLGQNFMGRFVALIESGNFLLLLDSKAFPADTTVRFPQRGGGPDTAPSVQLGCRRGFVRTSAPDRTGLESPGCVVCPAGSYSQEEDCIPCPTGFYQEQAGSSACVQCPNGKTTVSVGAFRRTHCVTDCQKNQQGFQCDGDGQYSPRQEQAGRPWSFCVDHLGRTLGWTVTPGVVTEAQCLVLRKFENVPGSKLIIGSEDAVILRSQSVTVESPPFQCIADCAADEKCGFVALVPEHSQVRCDLYAGSDDNFDCLATEQEQSILGNSAISSFGRLSCRLRVSSSDREAVTVYLKKGQEFTTTGRKTFERTDFRSTLSGLYSSVGFSAAGANLTDVHLFCHQACGRTPCCDGFILSQSRLRGGMIICGLLSSPDVLLCHSSDRRPFSPSQAAEAALCGELKSDPSKSQFILSLAGQDFASSEPLEEAQGAVSTFQQVYLWRDSDAAARGPAAECEAGRLQGPDTPTLTEPAAELFSPLDASQVVVDESRPLPSWEYRLLAPRFSAQRQAELWCLSQCAEEDGFCRLAVLQDSAGTAPFTCVLYPEARTCGPLDGLTAGSCQVVLPRRPLSLFQRKVVLGERVKNFYTRLPFQKLTGVSVQNHVSMSGKSISEGFLECEQRCDADPCCRGFGFLNGSLSRGGEAQCLTLSNLGFQSCSEEAGPSWQVSDCGAVPAGLGSYPFGWYQKPVVSIPVPTICPPDQLSRLPQEGPAGTWESLDISSVVVDPSIESFDVAHLSTGAPADSAIARDLCLSECSRNPSCMTTTLAILPGSIRCVFYPDTRSCTYSLQGPRCQLLLREPADAVFRRPGVATPAENPAAAVVTIASRGTLQGTLRTVRVGTAWRVVRQFLGVPYAAPPLAQNRFRPPEPFNWTETWDATIPRASCWLPGDELAQSNVVSEDCLYLNVFAPSALGPNTSVLVFFHHPERDSQRHGQLDLDGAYLAAVGNLIVVTATYRAGVFGFLSTGSGVARGNWGLQDQVAALQWVQDHIANFGGDPGRVTLAADRGGADVASVHLLWPRPADSRLFRRAILMGGSAFSPAAVLSEKRAQEQAAVLAREVGCPASGDEAMVSCFRQKPANILNDAQTKLLAISGPFQYWGPVVDGVHVPEPPARALRRAPPAKVDLLIGSSQQDGLISRARAIKRFEERQGRTSSKTAFYQALQNSLGGADADPGIQVAASWYYSLEHSSDDYSSFSRALENATRDYFITCPTVAMARHWAATGRGNSFMYHVPDSYLRSGSELLADVQLAFGLPWYPPLAPRFSQGDRVVALAVMQYIANFVKSGNPNTQYDFSSKIQGDLPQWAPFLPSATGENYKEFSARLPNLIGLKKADCSFWQDYIQTLRRSSGQEEAPALESTEPPALPEQGQKTYSR
ncbi:thyroglobulin [Tachyglossus aculeatus]|uniref:thyroglobulin n=1 Tax=Tachyglossus aculeatus TaxID=9261 RepID=UPI0018F6AB0D|nr:thyroglobulin [Tachyglossus aculeatus]